MRASLKSSEVMSLVWAACLRDLGMSPSNCDVTRELSWKLSGKRPGKGSGRGRRQIHEQCVLLVTQEPRVAHQQSMEERWANTDLPNERIRVVSHHSNAEHVNNQDGAAETNKWKGVIQWGEESAISSGNVLGAWSNQYALTEDGMLYMTRPNLNSTVTQHNGNVPEIIRKSCV